jgi:hypothetical protein
MRLRMSILAGVIILSMALANNTGALQSSGDPNPQEDAKRPKQGRRASLLAQRQDRLDKLKPAKLSKIVDLLDTIESEGFGQLITAQFGHFRAGFGKISPVSGIAPALQYERPRLGSSPLTLRMAGAYSIRGYWGALGQLGVFKKTAPLDLLGDGFLGAPFEFDNRSQKPLKGFLYLESFYRDFPTEEFFGIGPHSSIDERSDYRLTESRFDIKGGYPLARWLAFQTSMGYADTDIRDGTGDFPDTGDLFDETSAPGIEDPGAYFDIDSGVYLAWAGDPNLPAVELGLQYTRFKEIEVDKFRFDRYSFDMRGHLPLFSRQRTVAVRLHGSSDRPDEGSEVPFYLLKTLGGHDALRGYRDFRFRDRNLFHFSVEYRWEAVPALELALFYDKGKVFPHPSGFNFDNMKESYGFGIRAKSWRRVLFRAEIGRSEEDTLVFVSLGPAW